MRTQRQDITSELWKRQNSEFIDVKCNEADETWDVWIQVQALFVKRSQNTGRVE